MQLPSRRASSVLTSLSSKADSHEAAMRRFGRRPLAALAIAAIFVVAAVVLLRPADLGALTPTAHPSAGHAEAGHAADSAIA